MLVKSIQVYKYKLCPTISQLREKFGNGKKISRVVKDKDDVGEKITLITTISKIYETPQGIGGDIKHEVQIKQPHGDSDYIVWDPPYHFFIIPEHQLFILYGARDNRTSVENTLENFLSDDVDSGFATIFIPNEKMDKLVDRIQTQNIRNYIKKPRLDFDRLSDFGKMEKDTIKMHAGNCASRNPSFTKARKYATSWDCIMGVFKLNGIADDELDSEITFDITKQSTFTASISIEPKHWNRFILETCKGIVY